VDYWDGTPSLIETLRCESALHEEALEVFYETKICPISEKNMEIVGQIPDSAWKRVVELKV